MLQRILNRNNLIKTNHFHLQKSNVTLCPFFKPAYFKCLEKKKKKKEELSPTCNGFIQAIQMFVLKMGRERTPALFLIGSLVA